MIWLLIKDRSLAEPVIGGSSLRLGGRGIDRCRVDPAKEIFLDPLTTPSICDGQFDEFVHTDPIV